MTATTTYLQLVNDVNNRFNEVELTASNFSGSVGHYANAKQAVNNAIRDINRINFTWPFNFSSGSQTLTAGTMRYSFPSDAKFLDFNTFRIQRDDSIGNKTTFLHRLDYEEYLHKYSDDEYNTDTGIRDLPTKIVQAPNKEYIVWENPDAAYTLLFDYYKVPTALSAHDDTTEIPDDFRDVIVTGATHYVHFFRGEVEESDRANQYFREMIKDMRSIYVNRYEYVRDTRVHPYRLKYNQYITVS